MLVSRDIWSKHDLFFCCQQPPYLPLLLIQQFAMSDRVAKHRSRELFETGAILMPKEAGRKWPQPLREWKFAD